MDVVVKAVEGAFGNRAGQAVLQRGAQRRESNRRVSLLPAALRPSRPRVPTPTSAARPRETATSHSQPCPAAC
jgi:hypothetical protein